LITSAPMSPDEEFYRRRRRYAILMGTRAICIVAAVLTYRVSLVLALGLVAGGAILPWCAVIIANGRLLDRRRRPPARLPGPAHSRGLPSAEDAQPSRRDELGA
jgi:hypothetical protein